ncbi:hypothetical protein A2U01_0119312, partial [Trifolium medium]|nr:hypothetical protein [Trifolium medium]
GLVLARDAAHPAWRAMQDRFGPVCFGAGARRSSAAGK